MTSFRYNDQIEIYVRCEDCHVCGNEINPGREEYIRDLRVCPRCYGELRGVGGVARGHGANGPVRLLQS